MISLAAFIEKNTWSGLEDFYSNLARALHVETSTPRPGNGKSLRRKQKTRKTGKSLITALNSAGNVGNLGKSNGDLDDDDGEAMADYSASRSESLFLGLSRSLKTVRKQTNVI